MSNATFLSDSLQCNSNYVYNGVDTFLQQQPTHCTFFTIHNVFKKYRKLHFDLCSIAMVRIISILTVLNALKIQEIDITKILMQLQNGFGFIFQSTYYYLYNVEQVGLVQLGQHNLIESLKIHHSIKALNKVFLTVSRQNMIIPLV